MRREIEEEQRMRKRSKNKREEEIERANERYNPVTNLSVNLPSIQLDGIYVMCS